MLAPLLADLIDEGARRRGPLGRETNWGLGFAVRNIGGTLKLGGEGKWTADDVRAALDKKDRAAGGPTAPPEGLYLVEVVY